MPHLSISAVREGTDPPGSAVVPARNLTTLGLLDWALLGETAVGDRNYKTSAVPITSIVDIGSPAATRYAGSNDRQASLTSYTDGNSPASGGNRAWIGTGVNGAGWRITIALAGQSVRVKLGTGAYDGTHRIAASLADASAAAVSSDQVSGAAIVGWWCTDILACAAGAAVDLIIDITRISGGGGSNSCQFQWATLALGTPVIKSVTTGVVEGTGTAEIAGFVNPPAGAQSTLRGIAQALTTNTTTQVTFPWPLRTAIRYGGAHAGTRLDTNHTLVLGNGSESASAQVSIAPQQPVGFQTRNAIAPEVILPTYNGGAIVLNTGDKVLAHVSIGAATVNAASLSWNAISNPTEVEWTYFDESANSWSGMTLTRYAEIEFTGAMAAQIAALAGTMVKGSPLTGVLAAQLAALVGTIRRGARAQGDLAAGQAMLGGTLITQSPLTSAAPMSRVVSRLNRAVTVPFASLVLRATGPVTYSVVGSLPVGLTLNASTGVVTGVPTVEGLVEFILRISAASGVADVDVDWSVARSIPRLGLPSTRSAVFVVGF